ncbi:erythromycin esterase-like protein [Gillisia sp. Hel_I_86]|uniref:erythromycin esterase family protein n=1 Tax=Gillisia sp. Hel_I_86 TaxID=1249981 RepID=UPI00119B767B|nr:erythromycin esterase family protein [Gillisia sp. Hel_I_86]TVZ28068.1 erythromycin esterase-like protein [Gillisia sp. Hel_I_86]
MKFYHSILFFLSVVYLQAQELKTLPLSAPETENLDDLKFLDEELKDKRLVSLGELTHMYGNIFEMKIRVIKYLHQELGYSTIAIEAPIYDLYKLNLNTRFDPITFNESIFGVWSNSSEFQELVSYIEKNDINVIGFDSQVMNTESFLTDLFDYCEDKNIKIQLDEEDFAIVTENLLDNYTYESFDIKFPEFEKELKTIQKKINKLKDSEENYYWAQFMKGLLSSARDAYHNEKEILSTYFVDKSLNYRDEQMADNLLSYMSRNPSEKIIAWADNIHIINNMKSETNSIMKEFVPMGSILKKHLKDDVYSLATVHANDSIFQQKEWHKTPIQKPSFEHDLDSLNSPFLFVSSNQEAMKTIKSHRLLSFIDFTESRLDELHDGYIFIKNATISNSKFINRIEEKKSTPKDTVLATIKLKKDLFFLSGKIIDTQTNISIPYANLIMKKEEIYRVSGEDGAFNIPVLNKDVLNNSSISISSMGYETQVIPLKDLPSKIYLRPSMDELESVVIIANRTAKSVLKQAVKQLENNHPIVPFNYYRYSNYLLNKDDEYLIDLDIITKEYDQGYRQQNRLTQRVEQIKWNKQSKRTNLKSVRRIYQYRQNPIRYSNILHRRKYKKFNLSFNKSNKLEDEGLYIISFNTDRNNWNYTNRGYPTTYSGKVYIDKVDFAIVKVVENWETTLNNDDIEKHYRLKQYENKNQLVIKEEYIANFAKDSDQKYYATNYFQRKFIETKDSENLRENVVIELKSSIFDLKKENIEIIDYDHYQNNEVLLNRVKFNETFWRTFKNEFYQN